ncbi:helix-turn-helix transcriptional regulator [Paludibacterium sp. B53371]|uniref:ArsR/SmtB family transcription factor n=1 Tax=Paludibacterium sp. B53371 TaxID=2806263 RepID=UPI001C04EB92|nr:helix-turn-helix transcriptional regulator [Paludibacterium sp. B53371]
MEEDWMENRLAALAAAVADKTRARMLCALLDGRAYTATELAVVAGVAASTASSHLARLQQQQWIECLPQGRHRYFRLAGVPVAEALEQLLGLVAAEVPVIRRQTPEPLRYVRTCYDHLAGEVAVQVHDRLFRLGWLDGEHYALTETGQQGLARLGVDGSGRAGRRRFACRCLDWSERRPHLGGQLGAALLEACRQQQWVLPVLDSRALQLTALGRRQLQAHLGLVF